MELKKYLREDAFKVKYMDKKLNIVNFISIEHLDSNKIILKYEEGRLIVSGVSLVIQKLLQDEILITGQIKTIEFG